jgi:hypothetical protein
MLVMLKVDLFSQKRFGFFLTILIAFLSLNIFHYKVLFSPNSYVIAGEGDAIKNYYNFAWQIKNGTSATEFKGMSYPFGETLVLEDSLPFWSSVLRPLSKIFPSLGDYSIGILNLLLFFSFVVGAVFMYKIFRHYQLTRLLAALSANAVVFLSSQILLMYPSGHWGLTFVCFFPISWYLLIRHYNERENLKWSVLIALNILLWSFTHIYLGLIIVLFTLAVQFFHFIVNRRYPRWKIIMQTGVQVLFPLFVIFGLIKMFDAHPNRIDMPFLSTYRTSLNLVFLPILSPFRQLYGLVFDLSKQKELVWSRTGNYIGFTSNLAIIAFVILSIWFIIKKKYRQIKQFLPGELTIYLLAAIVLLLFAMAIPQRFLSHQVIDCFPPLKQFSSLGRFAWVFYFVMVTSGMVFFFRILNYRKWGKPVLFLLVGLLIMEGFFYHKKISEQIGKQVNPFSKQHIGSSDSLLLTIDTKCYQAILPIPYYFQFSLPFGSSNSDKSIYASMVASYHSGLPIMSTYLSRPSVSESLEIFKQLMPAPYRLMLPQVLADGRDVAVIVPVSDIDKMNANEQNIIRKSQLVAKDSVYQIYRLTVDSLMHNNPNEFDRPVQFSSTSTDLLQVYLSFDSLTSDFTYKGLGAYKGLKKDFNLVYRTSTASMDTAKDYLISFWYYNYLWDQTFTSLLIAEDEENKNLQYQCISPLDALVIDGSWYLNQHRFKIHSRSSTLSIFFNGGDYFKDWFLIDELTIRPVCEVQK